MSVCAYVLCACTSFNFFLLVLSISTVQFIFFAEASTAFTIESKSWLYQGHSIAYEEAKRIDIKNIHINDDDDDDRPSSSSSRSYTYGHDHSPIVLLNGFGVGSFHQHRLMPNLVSVHPNPSSNDDSYDNSNDTKEEVRIVYGIDYLGQGKSWPIECQDGNSKSEQGLTYSIDTWADQIIQFIEQVVIPNQYHYNNQKKNHSDDLSIDDDSTTHKQTKIHLIGNSVGGHLAVLIAKLRPDLIESICLLNATPVWGLNLPGWDGKLPPPLLPRKIGRYLFDMIRNLDTIDKYLENAYSNRMAFDNNDNNGGDVLMRQIRSCTEGEGGHAAFASILWSSPASFVETSSSTTSGSGERNNNKLSFYCALEELEVDVLLIFGKDDPWCTPAFAKRMYQSLAKRKQKHQHVQRYIELENVGHCPNHEAPQIVGHIATRWTSSKRNQRHKDCLVLLDPSDSDLDTDLDTDIAIDDEGKNGNNKNDRHEQPLVMKEPWGDIIAHEIKDEDVKLTLIEKIITSMV